MKFSLFGSRGVCVPRAGGGPAAALLTAARLPAALLTAARLPAALLTAVMFAVGAHSSAQHSGPTAGGPNSGGQGGQVRLLPANPPPPPPPPPTLPLKMMKATHTVTESPSGTISITKITCGSPGNDCPIRL